MLGRVTAWLVVCALLYVPGLANLAVNVWARRVRDRHDWEIEDDLPQTAGQWVGERLAMLGTHAIVTDDEAPTSSNAYYTHVNLIQLTHEAHFKADPVYWAVAAHELGHAHLHQRHRFASYLLAVARRLKQMITGVGLGMAIGNVLYALPGVTQAAFVLLVIAVVLDAAELVDEAWASRWAYRELSTSAHLTPRHLAAVRATLVSSYLTYVVTFLAHAALLLAWPLVEQITGGGLLAETAPLGGFELVIVILGLVFGLGFAAVRIIHALAPTSTLWRLEQARGMTSAIGTIAYVLLVCAIASLWNVRDDPTWAWCVILAIVPIVPILVGILALPFAAPFALLRRALLHLEGPGVERSQAYERALAVGHGLIKAGNSVIRKLIIEIRVDPRLTHRLAEVMRLLYVPLYVVWLGTAS